MKRLLNLFSQILASKTKARCPFCGEDILVEYSLSICPHCFGTINFSPESTRKTGKREVIRKGTDI